MVELGHAFGFEVSAEQSDGDAGRLVQNALASFNGLLILDNAENTADTRLFLPPPGGPCRVIVTSRNLGLLRNIDQKDPVELGIFTPEQGRECFGARIGNERFSREADDIDELCGMLEGLPIAIDVAAGSINDRDEQVSAWVKAYPDERKLLDQLGEQPGGDESGLTPEQARRRRIVRAVLRLSLRDLPELSCQLLYCLSCFEPATGGPEPVIVLVAQIGESDQAAVGLELSRRR